MTVITKQSFLEKKSMSQDLATLIKQQIISGHLNPGDRIVETKLAKELGISQTPVREAIRLLSGEGIITIVPNKGPIVKSLEAKDIFEIYSLRSSLEGLAIRLTTQLATDEQIRRLVDYYKEMEVKLHDDTVETLLSESFYLHRSIIRLSNHSRVQQVYESISFQIELNNHILGRTSTKQKEYDDHYELIDALQKRDPAYSEQVMRKHIYRSYRECVELMQRNDTENKNSKWLLWPEAHQL